MKDFREEIYHSLLLPKKKHFFSLFYASGRAVAANMCMGPTGDESGVSVGECAIRWVVSFLRKEWQAEP